MSKKRLIKMVAFFVTMLTLSQLCTGCYKQKKLDYYAEKNNYIEVTGIISSVKYDEDKTALYFNFSQLDPTLDGICLKIVGENVAIVQNNGIDDLVQEGTQVHFVTAPRYFGDGYVMPIVAITADDVVLLEFEDGYNNLIDWLRE